MKRAPFFTLFLLPLACATRPSPVAQADPPDPCLAYATHLSQMARIDDDGQKLVDPASAPALIEAFRFETGKPSAYKALHRKVLTQLPALNQEDYLELFFGNAGCNPVIGEYAAVRGLLLGVEAKQIDGETRKTALDLAKRYLRQNLAQPGNLLETTVLITVFEKLGSLEPSMKASLPQLKGLQGKAEKLRAAVQQVGLPPERWPKNKADFSNLRPEEKQTLLKLFKKEIRGTEDLRREMTKIARKEGVL